MKGSAILYPLPPIGKHFQPVALTVILGPTASASAENLFKGQNLWYHPRPTEADLPPGLGPNRWVSQAFQLILEHADI